MTRIYLDHNATTPLRPQARAAMIAAMDALGNPSSVHVEGRVAKGLVEAARLDLAEALGALGADLVFTSGATEAAALALSGRGLQGSAVEHDAVLGWIDPVLPVGSDGLVTVADPGQSALQLANSETGIVQSLPAGLAVSDISQAVGRLPFAYNWAAVGMVLLSGHKFGGPKGVGALIMPQGHELTAQLRGGGQELGRRAGTENIIGIVGMAVAAKIAVQELAAGVCDKVAQLRNILEEAVEAAAPDTIFIGRDAARLPNTACFASRAWKGETQVMAMDLSGVAISAGSACSSGKVRESRVLRAMGHDAEIASSAVRISLGPDTTEAQVLQFARIWAEKLKKRHARAA